MPLSQKVAMLAASRKLAIILLLILSAVSIVGASSSDVRSHPVSTQSGRQSWRPPRHARDETQSLDDFEVWEIFCLYPLSGMYCKLQRILVYCVAILTFCLRSHTWFTAVGVSFLMSYTTITAIHGVALLLDSHSHRDSDSLLISYLLSTNLQMTTNFYMFTPRFFQDRKKWIITMWTFVITGAYISIAVPQNISKRDPYEDTNIQVCTYRGKCVDTCRNYMARPMFRGLDEELFPIPWRKLGFQDYNTSLSVIDPWILAEELAANLTDRLLSGQQDYEVKSIPTYHPDLLTVVVSATAITWTYGLYIYGLNHSPRSIRNFVFRQCTAKDTKMSVRSWRAWARCLLFFLWPVSIFYHVGKYVLLKVMPSWKIIESSSMNTLPCRNMTKSRCCIAVFFAVVSFAWSYCAFMLPFQFLSRMVSTEQYIAKVNIPEQEVPLNIGQWSTWISIGIAFLVVIRHHILVSEKLPSQDSSLWMFRGEKRREYEQWPTWKCMWVHGRWNFPKIKETWEEFKEWLQDPMASSWGEALTDGIKIWELSEITVHSYPQPDGILSSGIMVSSRLTRSRSQLAYQ